MDGESNGAHSPHGHSPHGQLVGGWWSPASTDVMSQLCRVCGEPAAGFHFGAFTCEGCKSFFGRTYNNLGSITECKNQGSCVINKKNRTSCKACRLRKCLLVGMSKSGSRYGRRSNWFKIHCLLQEQQHQHQQHQQQQHQQQQEQQRQQHAAPPVSPPDKSPKGSPSVPRGAATDALFGGAPLPAMLWGTPRGLLPPPPHGHPLQLPFPPFLPAAAAAAAAAFNGGVTTPLFPLPPAHPAHPPRPEWTRHSSPLPLARPGSTSPPPSPRIRAVLKTVVAPLGPPVPPPRRSPPVRSPPPRATASPRLDVDDTLEQEQPMDLSRTAAASGRQDTDEASDRDEGSDSGVSERESDRGKDGDADGAANGSPASSPGSRPPLGTPLRPASPALGAAAAPVDLTARHS